MYLITQILCLPRVGHFSVLAGTSERASSQCPYGDFFFYAITDLEAKYIKKKKKATFVEHLRALNCL